MIFGSKARREKKAAARLAEAQASHRAGEQLAAIREYTEALELGAPQLDTRLQIAILHAELGQPALAAGHLEKILAADPAHADAGYMLGAVKYDLGLYAESAALCLQALEKRPGLLQAHFTLALTYAAQRDFRRAAQGLARSFAERRGPPWAADRIDRLAEPAPQPQFVEEDMAVSAVKLTHDCEQLEHLLAQGRLPSEFAGVAAEYRRLLGAVRRSSEGHVLEAFDTGQYPLVARTYKRPLHIDSSPAPAGDMLNPGADWSGAEQRYLGSSPSVTVIDGLLSPEALAALRRYCIESTLWNDVRAGYLGAYLDQGFAPEVLLRIAAELRARLPGVIRDYSLQTLWAYKYDSTMPGMGIALHADTAAVNVNFWITQDDANLDPEHGGLLVHLHKAPPEWSFAKFNRDWQAIVDFLEARGSVPLRVPYRCNRAVIFDSDLFHATDAPRFRAGYTNRRINVTLLYGQRRSAPPG